MAKKNRKSQQRDLRNLAEQEYGPTVVVMAIGDSQSLSEGSGPDEKQAAQDVRLVRSALLYAPRVELVSPAVAYLKRHNDLANSGPKGLIQLMDLYSDPRYSKSVGISANQAAEIAQLMRGMLQFQESYPRRLVRSRPDIANDPTYLSNKAQLDQILGSGYDSVRSNVERQYREIWQQYGGDQIQAAIDSGALVFRGSDFFSDSEDTELDLLKIGSQLKQLLTDPNAHVLMDDHIRELAGIQSVSDHPYSGQSLKNSSRAATGTRFISHLPVFPKAGMQDILEARNDLAELRQRYFRSVGEFASNLESSVLEIDHAAEIDAMWRDEVHPQVVELANAVSQTRLGGVAKFTTDLARRFPEKPVPTATFGIASFGLTGLDLDTIIFDVLAAILGNVGMNARDIAKERRIQRENQDKSGLQYLVELTRVL
ncbi:hypothetical protein SFC07_07265 [Corynebacterium callunae]|uniref:hypothetical protein n=1 Tax=Corynebacterium callunae TaxID=1721 RepID=UPI0039823A21